MSLKKKLTQDELRKAMNEHKKKLGVVKKIESPLAKYTDAGQLMCILCKTLIRGETVWPVHLNSKTHKENIILAKTTKLEPQPIQNQIIQSNSIKRPVPPGDDPPNKKIKSILKNPIEPSKKASSLPPDFFDDNSKKPGISTALVNTQKKESGSNQPNSSENMETESVMDNREHKEINSATLPEGFFDDPVLDAKIRNVEYKNPIEEEWDKFQKAIKEETAQSAQIIADDQEEATTERQLDEIEEQIRHWSRVMDLVKRKEQVQAVDRKPENVESDVSSEDEEDFDEFLDWRAKNS